MPEFYLNNFIHFDNCRFQWRIFWWMIIARKLILISLFTSASWTFWFLLKLPFAMVLIYLRCQNVWSKFLAPFYVILSHFLNWMFSSTVIIEVYVGIKTSNPDLFSINFSWRGNNSICWRKNYIAQITVIFEKVISKQLYCN